MTLDCAITQAAHDGLFDARLSRDTQRKLNEWLLRKRLRSYADRRRTAVKDSPKPFNGVSLTPCT